MTFSSGQHPPRSMSYVISITRAEYRRKGPGYTFGRVFVGLWSESIKRISCSIVGRIPASILLPRHAEMYHSNDTNNIPRGSWREIGAIRLRYTPANLSNRSWKKFHSRGRYTPLRVVVSLTIHRPVCVSFCTTIGNNPCGILTLLTRIHRQPY